jgi:hypothetical protein
LVVEPFAFAFEPREGAEGDAVDVYLQAQPQAQFAGDAVGIGQAVLDFDLQSVEAALLGRNNAVLTTSGKARRICSTELGKMLTPRTMSMSSARPRTPPSSSVKRLSPAALKRGRTMSPVR